MSYYFHQPATCTKCGHKRPSNGSDDDGAIKLDGFTVCPECFEAMLRQFCGHMKPDNQFASPHALHEHQRDKPDEGEKG